MTTLAEYIATQQRRVFRYGVFDCCTFVADCVQVMCGDDPMRELRGTYGKENQRQVLKRLGGLDGAVRSLLGAEPIAAPLVLHGDVVTVPASTGGEALGIVCSGNAYSPTARGVSCFPLSAIIHAWRLPLCRKL